MKVRSELSKVRGFREPSAQAPGSEEPRVLIVIAETIVSGPAKGVIQLMEVFRGEPGCYRLVNCLVRGAEASKLSAGAARRGVEITHVEASRRGYFRLAKKVARLATACGAAVVQTHGFKPTLIGLYLKYALGLHWVCFMHGTTAENWRVRVYNNLDNLMQRLADRTILVSRAQRGWVLGGGDLRRVRVIHNAVDSESPVATSGDAGGVRQAMGVAEHAPLISVVGRLSPEKGIDVFLEAFRRLRVRLPGVRAALVGDGPERARLESLCAALDLGEAVRFVGHKATPGDYLMASDLVALPSRSEGSPNVALEAMALGKPVVATAVGGLVELIEPEVSGLLVPREEPAALAEAMARVLETPELRASLAERGRQRVREHFSPAARARAVIAVYRELLDEAGSE
jgi:glycosyltransferase involved in cell wall biosynthesis